MSWSSQVAAQGPCGENDPHALRTTFTTKRVRPPRAARADLRRRALEQQGLLNSLLLTHTTQALLRWQEPTRGQRGRSSRAARRRAVRGPHPAPHRDAGPRLAGGHVQRCAGPRAPGVRGRQERLGRAPRAAKGAAAGPHVRWGTLQEGPASGHRRQHGVPLSGGGRVLRCGRGRSSSGDQAVSACRSLLWHCLGGVAGMGRRMLAQCASKAGHVNERWG